MSNAIEIHGLRKWFRTERGWRDAMRPRDTKLVLDGIDLVVRRGEVFGLLGPNGAGKTTLMKILCGLVAPDAGDISVLGFDALVNAGEVRRRVGLVYGDERSFFWRLSVRENLRFYAALYGIRGKAADRRIDELLMVTGLQEAADLRMYAFSSGMKHRAAIARGLIHDPAVLILDEPTRSLDPLGAEDLHRLIREGVATGGRTVVIATHLMSEAEDICDRLTLIDRGTTVLTGTTADFRRVAEADDIVYRLSVRGGEDGWSSAIRAIPGVVNVESSRDTAARTHLELALRRQGTALALVIRRVLESGGEIESCSLVEPTLEEVFRTIMRGRKEPVLRVSQR